ncbi:MAG: hypothetical protein HFJ54_03800 [Clostridia bacterium]|nr:hypothetical protein [Clostridia bacterium]
MKENTKIINKIVSIVFVISVCLIVLLSFNLIKNKEEYGIKFPWDNFVAQERVVVVKVYENSILVQRRTRRIGCPKFC